MKLDVLVSTPDHRSPLTQRCLDTLRDTTRHIPYTLHIADNRYEDKWRHSNEINNAMLGACDFLLTLDDDCWFEDNGWLDSMICTAKDNGYAGIVGASIWRNPEMLWSNAVWIEADGKPVNWRQPIDKPERVIACCSCCWLMRPYVELDTRWYRKYYFDIDACYNVNTYVSPKRIFHQGGGHAQHNPETQAALVHDREMFLQNWPRETMRELYNTMRGVVAHPLPEIA